MEAGHEVVSHGWRWIDYQFVPEDVERDHIRRAVGSITRVTGSRPLGWYTGRLSPSTRRLVVIAGPYYAVLEELDVAEVLLEVEEGPRERLRSTVKRLKEARRAAKRAVG